MSDGRGSDNWKNRQQGLRITQLLLAAGLITPFVAPAFAMVAASRTPGYSHISGTYSDLSAQGHPQPEIMATGLVLTGLLTIAAGFGLVRVMPGLQRGFLLAVTLAGQAITMTGIVQDYPRGKGGTWNPEAFAHNAFVGVAIIAILACMALFVRGIRQQPGWQYLRGLTLFCLAGTLFAATLLQFGSPNIDGLAERILTAFTFLWLIAASANGLLLSGEQQTASSKERAASS